MLYAALCYTLGLAVTAWYAVFLLHLWSPSAADATNFSTGLALLIDVGLIILFGIQHTGMARQFLKKRFSRIFPQAAERSTYILLTSICLGLLMWLWQPLPITIFDLRGTAAGTVFWILYGLGWFVGLSSTYLINHWDLFGLRQAWLHLKNQTDHSFSFRTPLYYQFVRHPIYVGWLLIHWMTPYLPLDHLLLAGGMTMYILIGIYFEEKDLVRFFGERYLAYREKVPALIPFSKKTQKLPKHENSIVV